jgi:hypothetical protein
MDELEAARVTRHEFHPERNYRVHPTTTRPKEPK